MLDPVAGIVFDLDGTVVDSGLDFAAMRSETGCPTGVGLLEFIDAMDSASERERAHAVIHHHEMIGARAATWMPGAKHLLHRLTATSIPIGIFTRNSREAAGLVIETLGIPCNDLVAREDAAAKPDPEGLLEIAGRWQLPPRDMLAVGDFLFDLQAASKAGMRACLYDPRGESPYGLEADFVIGHFDELAELLFGE